MWGEEVGGGGLRRPGDVAQKKLRAVVSKEYGSTRGHITSLVLKTINQQVNSTRRRLDMIFIPTL